MRVSARF